MVILKENRKLLEDENLDIVTFGERYAKRKIRSIEFMPFGETLTMMHTQAYEGYVCRDSNFISAIDLRGRSILAIRKDMVKSIHAIDTAGGTRCVIRLKSGGRCDISMRP